MGRILKALIQGGNHRAAADQGGSAYPSRTENQEAAAIESDAIPFIEVGGPGSAVEGSPQVLAFPQRPIRVPVPAQPVASTPEPGAAPAPPADDVPEEKLAAVVFQSPYPSQSPLPPARQRFAPQLVAFHQPDHPVSEQYRGLLAGVVGQMLGDDPRVLMLTAPAAGSGTTTVLLNLALTRARSDQKRVVVVDAQLYRPAVADRLGLRPSPGLREVVARSVLLRRAIQETGQTNCWALTAGDPILAGNAWPVGEALRATLLQLRQQFDWVLVDAPSWADGAEMVGLSAACDAVFLVLRPGEVETNAVKEIGRLIPQVGSHLGGYILTER